MYKQVHGNNMKYMSRSSPRNKKPQKKNETPKKKEGSIMKNSTTEEDKCYNSDTEKQNCEAGKRCFTEETISSKGTSHDQNKRMNLNTDKDVNNCKTPPSKSSSIHDQNNKMTNESMNHYDETPSSKSSHEAMLELVEKLGFSPQVSFIFLEFSKSFLFCRKLSSQCYRQRCRNNNIRL